MNALHPADLVALAHLAYVLFVASGYVLVPLGWWRGWRWVRHRIYRRLHVAAIALVAVEALLGWVCPLTELEWALRGGARPGTFMGRIVHALLYADWPVWVFTVLYAGLLLLALAMYRLLPPLPRPVRRR